MQVQNLGAIIAVIALVISIWTRLETVVLGRRQQRLDQAKRIGEALVACQQLKNELSDNCRIVSARLKSGWLRARNLGRAVS